MEHGSRTRLMTAMIIAVVFVAGLLVGLAADGTLDAQPPEAVVEVTESAEPEEPRRRTPMYEQVGPSEAQMAQIEAIVSEHRARMDALHDEFRSAYNPRYRAVVEESREAILAVMTPEQADEYQVLLDDYDRRRAERAEKKNRD